VSIAALCIARHTLVRVFGRCAPLWLFMNPCTNFREFPLCEVRASSFLATLNTRNASSIISGV